MQIVLEYVRPAQTNLIEIHCSRREVETVSQSLSHLTGKLHRALKIGTDDHAIFISDQVTMEEAEALLVGLRHWGLTPEKMTRDRLQTVIRLEAFHAQLTDRQNVHNLEAALGLSSYDYADMEAGD
jgi:hypothetical protein